MNFRKLIFLVLCILFLPIILNAQETSTCNDDMISIDSITLNKKVGNIEELSTPTIDGKNIGLDLKMTEQGSFIQYKMVVTNSSNVDYEFGNNLNTSTNYVTYTYSSEDSNNIIAAGQSKTVYLKVEYTNVPPEDAFNEGILTDDSDLTLNLSTDIEETPTTPIDNNTNNNNKDENIKNPKTGTQGMILFLVVTLFMGGIMYVVFGKNAAIKHFVIVLSLMLFIPYTIYAACTCKINIKSKIKIEYVQQNITIDKLKNNVVNSGDGLYVDNNTTNRYVYRGQNPNNYIKLENNELFRIISIEPNNTIKVIKETSIGTIPFDPGYTNEITGVTSINSLQGTRIGNSSQDLCYSSTSNNYFGCKVWSSNDSTYKIVNGNASKMTTFPKIIDSTAFNLPNDNAYLNVYLNGGTYMGTNITAWSDNIDSSSGTFYIGPVEYNENQTLKTDINQEKEYYWNGRFGLMSVSDYVQASSKQECRTVYSYVSDNSCYQNSTSHNYLTLENKHEWTISPVSASNNNRVWSINTNGSLDNSTNSNASNSYEVRPVLYLFINGKIEGTGAKTDPYTYEK